MEWLIAVPVALMFALCAFMMLSMMVRGWLGGSRHGGHGMMMCMGHGADHEPRTPDRGLLEELKSERETGWTHSSTGRSEGRLIGSDEKRIGRSKMLPMGLNVWSQPVASERLREAQEPVPARKSQGTEASA